MSESGIYTLNLTNGSLVLRSEKSKKLVHDLLDNGMFWEYISVLIEERASGGQNYVEHLNKKIDEVSAKLDKLIAGGGAVITASSTGNSTGGSGQDSLNSRIGDMAVELIEETKKVILDASTIKGKGVSAILKMKSMTRGN